MPRLQVVAFVVLGLAASGYSALAQEATTPPLPAVMASPVEKSRFAIADCRERRLRKELNSYKESADCSNPKIFAAWQEANYPHMDLITAWLSARQAASEKVDQRLITPQEFEREMDDLTIRLTAEEQRRRAGLVNSSDSDLVLQLPPSTQVVGVATPPGQEKLAAKKTAAARARAAANSQYGASAAGSPSVSALSTGGVGGPFVPASGGTGSAHGGRTQMAAVAPGEGSRGLYAHLSSQRSEAEARAAFRVLQSQFPTVLAGRDAVIRRADDANQGTYYRVEIGPLSSGQADELCGTIKSAGGQCISRFE